MYAALVMRSRRLDAINTRDTLTNPTAAANRAAGADGSHEFSGGDPDYAARAAERAAEAEAARGRFNVSDESSSRNIRPSFS